MNARKWKTFVYLSVPVLLVSFLSYSSCRSTSAPTELKDATVTSNSVNGIAGSTKNLCVGAHGNGNLIMAHFGAFARIVEHFGLFDGMAGGSSSSVSLFIYESIYANKSLKTCATGTCSKEEEGRRAGLLLKSLQGYLSYVANSTDEAAVFQGLLPIYKKAKDQGMDELLTTDAMKARDLIVKLLESPDVSDIINKELIHLLKNSPNPGYHTRTVYEGLANISEWKTDDPVILVRPGIIDFIGLGKKIGRIGNFYAGYGPADHAGMAAFLDKCATLEHRQQSWDEIIGPANKRNECGRLFFDLLSNYRKKLLTDETSYPSRINDDIGLYLPSLISTSILEGQRAADRFAKSRKNFLAGNSLEWESDFSDVQFGYWGTTNDLKLLATNKNGFSDLKTKKFLSLGQQKWKEVLLYSPAEPGLSRAQEMSPTRISAGGWSDLHPVLALKNIGCQKVIYVSRRGEPSQFAIGMGNLLGMTAPEQAALYPLKADASGNESSYLQALKNADGVWCTNWNTSATTNISGTVAEAYNAPFEARNSAPIAIVPYPNSAADLSLLGCTPAATQF